MKRIAVILMLALVCAPALAETYAEKLGWEKGDRVLILHIDDAGMSYDSNLGTIRAMTEGIANSVSVMMPCPWVPHFVHWLKDNPEVDAGLHLTMTSEWSEYRWGPLAGKTAVPGLTDEEGCLHDNVPLVVQNASPQEVKWEIHAQIERARTMGFEPTHMDSHMGTLFATPEFLQQYIEAGIATQIPVMLPGGHNTLLREQYRQGTYATVAEQNKGREEGEKIDPEATWKMVEQERFGSMQELADKTWNGGLPVLDDLHNTSYGWELEEKVEKYVEAIKSLEPGVTMLIMHCTDPTEVFDVISGSGDSRLGDLNAMLAPEVKKALEDEKIILTTWRELKQRRDALK